MMVGLLKENTGGEMSKKKPGLTQKKEILNGSASHYKCLPCPFCGESRNFGHDNTNQKPFGIHAGRESSQSMNVKCFTCFASVVRDMPEEYPSDMPKSLRGWDSINWLAERTLIDCVAAWNQRASQLPTSVSQ